MLLNFMAQGEGKPILLIHGLLGDAKNLGALARELQKTHKAISVDLRNHGRSFHDDAISHELMAQDVIAVLDHLAIPHCDVIGHSLGGKVAMKLAHQAPERVDHLIVLDMSPVAYTQHRHRTVFDGLQAVSFAKPNSRQAAEHILMQHIDDPAVIPFLLKSLTKQGEYWDWCCHVPALIRHYDDLMDWQPIAPFQGKTLFMKGGTSDYLQAEHQTDIMAQFPNAKAHVIANAGHWLHAEKPQAVLRAIEKFLATPESNDATQSVV